VATIDIGRNWEAPSPFGGGELGPHLTPCGHGPTPTCKPFHLDPSHRLATVHQRHRQTSRTDRQTDSIGRTVSQTVAQKQVVGVILTKRPHRRSTWTVQSYSSGGATNVHDRLTHAPWAHPSQYPKQRLDRFSHFCKA